jgi:biotin carboxylase
MTGSRQEFHVLVVGGGRELPERLRQIGPEVRTAVLCRAETLGTVNDVGGHRVVVTLPDDSTTQDWVTAARQVNAVWPLDAVVSFSDVDVHQAAAVAQALELSFHSPRTVMWVNDKAAMRARLQITGVDQLPFRVVRSVAELAAFIDEVGPPVVVKPTGGRGSVGVTVIHNAAGVAAAFERAVSATAPRSRPTVPIAERFVEGPCLTVDAVTHDGMHYVTGVHEAIVTESTGIDLAHVSPPRGTAAQTEAAAALVREVLTALEVRRGITNTDVVMSSDGPVVLETHVRPSGNRLPSLGLHTTGVDVLDLWLRQVAGRDIGPGLARAMPLGRAEPFGAAAVHMLMTDQRGELIRISGWEQVRARPGVTAAGQLLPDGSLLEGIASDFSSLGFVEVEGPTPAAALALAADMVAQLTVQVAPRRA